MTKKEQKAMKTRVERAYYAGCSGIAINIMDIGKVFAFGEEYIRRMSPTDEELKDAIFLFVRGLAVDPNTGARIEAT
jgi:hypothetical protein